MGTIMRPIQPGKDLEVDVDASFCGDWDPKEAVALDQDNARSRHGYVIIYAGCPLLLKSQLQTEDALFTTESKYNFKTKFFGRVLFSVRNSR